MTLLGSRVSELAGEDQGTWSVAVKHAADLVRGTGWWPEGDPIETQIPDYEMALRALSLVIYATARVDRVEPQEVTVDRLAAWVERYVVRAAPSSPEASRVKIRVVSMRDDLAEMLTDIGHDLPEGALRTWPEPVYDDPVAAVWWRSVQWMPEPIHELGDFASTGPELEWGLEYTAVIVQEAAARLNGPMS